MKTIFLIAISLALLSACKEEVKHSYIYNDEIVMIGGFYKGCKGRVIEHDSYHDTYVIEFDGNCGWVKVSASSANSYIQGVAK